MLSMGYEIYQKDDTVFIKHGGKVQQCLPLAEVEALVRNSLKEEGFTIRQEADATYAINSHSHILINLAEEGFDLNRLKPQWQGEDKQQP